MSYPDYPDNRLIVNGVDLTEKFGLVLLDGYTLSPPEPKTYTVDIPGGNGILDLTESLLGDTPYGNRSQTFTFAAINVENFEYLKRKVSNFLHGKSFNYTMTMDPGYTYHGRFSVSSYSHSAFSSGILGTIEISIDADPFKMARNTAFRIPAVGGSIVYFVSGRKRVVPKIEASNNIKVIKDNKLTTLPKGTWTINDLYFTEGVNEMYFNSFDVHNLTWGNLLTNQVTCGNFETRRLFQWYKSNGDGTYAFDTWGDELSKTWTSMSNSSWGSLMYMSEVTKDVKDIYVEYEVGEL